MPTTVDTRRIRTLKTGAATTGPVMYWMIRDQRVDDNWALLYAQEQALQQDRQLIVVFCLRKDLRTHSGTSRMWQFMRGGLEQVSDELQQRGIGFRFLLGDPIVEVKKLVETEQTTLLVTDFCPLKVYQDWKVKLAKQLHISFHEVDAHNIVPCWLASDKQEFAARTFRPKINRLLPEFLTGFPSLKSMPSHLHASKPDIDWVDIDAQVQVNQLVKPVEWCRPGKTHAERTWQRFLADHLEHYADDKNDPTKPALSNMSPYLHFGQIAAQRMAIDLQSRLTELSNDAYSEELIIRRELSDNFCFYNPNYDKVEGFPSWAKKTLDHHRSDPRTASYSFSALAAGRTEEPLWNAAQLQLVKTGKMHGYLRMYWAKKILEWTPNPEEAIKIAIELNDVYSLDGRDPNGYVGIAWSIGGVHDRPWFDRPVYGQIRYMSQSGAARKFDVEKFIQTWGTV